jgi:predicted 3-demethylubiquinone-9 3-methyltransferase (glyoxalase superfamily)
MNKIAAHLWFDTQAAEAAQFYCKVFGGTMKGDNTIEDTPSGNARLVSFSLPGLDFMAISAGPYFQLNPSISFMVDCETKEEVDSLYNQLKVDGKPLMELGEYPFCERYGWIQDKFGVSWQLLFAGVGQSKQKIRPSIMFIGDHNGQASEAVDFYTSVFPNSQVQIKNEYGEGNPANSPNNLSYAGFTLNHQYFAAMDGGINHDYKLNEAISLVMSCEDQKELDKYWEALSAVPESEQCGWLKDKFGVSWQIVPTAMNKMLSSGDKDAVKRVTQAFLKMKKFDIAELERVFSQSK